MFTKKDIWGTFVILWLQKKKKSYCKANKKSFVVGYTFCFCFPVFKISSYTFLLGVRHFIKIKLKIFSNTWCIALLVQ